jgi:hypothetical protein
VHGIKQGELKMSDLNEFEIAIQTNEFYRRHEEEKRKLNKLFPLGVEPNFTPPVYKHLPKLPPINKP